MTEVENLQRALQAKYELNLTAEAYLKTRLALMKDAETAGNPDDAWQAVLQMRALDAVMKRLKDHITTSDLDKVGKDQ